MIKWMLALGLCISATMAAFAEDENVTWEPQQKSSNVAVLLRSGDDFTPWPWGAEMPFPWSFVQGTWIAEKGEFRSYYSFRVVKDSEESRQLEVTQVDPINCTIMAHGVAIETENTVRAQMSNTATGAVYRLSLRSFHEKSLPTLVGQKPINNQFVVMSVLPFDTVKPVHLPIQQVSNQLNFKCRVQQ